MRSVSQLVLLAALVATTSTALAQQRGPRGFGGGVGGPGGSPSGAMLLGQKSVQEDLKLSEDQVKQVEEFAEEQRQSFSGLRDASREERMKKFTESQAAGQKAVDTILNDEQRTRLKQISLQLAGPAAFASPEVAEKLGFTDEQKNSLEEIQSAHREEMRSLMQGGEGNRGEAFRKMQAARQATAEKLQGVLTDEQKTKWQELTGKKFEGQMQGPGGRGFGRGRRANQDAGLRHDNDTTVLTADKSDEAIADKQSGKATKDSAEQDAKQKHGDSKKKHAKHGKHRGYGKHAARHHGRGPHARHAHHRHAYRGRPMHGFAHRGPHRPPHARLAHHGHRPAFGGPFHGPHFAHFGPHHFGPHHFGPHHFGPGRQFGPRFDARHHAWDRMAWAMGHRGPRSFSHAGHRQHGHPGPHRFAHHGHGERHHFGPPRGWDHGNRHSFAAHHRGPRHGYDEHRMSGFGGPGRPNFAWHIERHREDGAGIDHQYGSRGHHPSQIHPAGFQRRHHPGADEHPHKRGEHGKHHAKRPAKKDTSARGGEKAPEKDSDKSEKKDD